jgi:chromosome segregation ATPase
LVPTASYQKIEATLTAVHLEISDCDKKLRARMLASNDIGNKLRVAESEVAGYQSELEKQKPALAGALAAQNTLQDQMASIEREGVKLQEEYRSALEAFKESAAIPDGPKLTNARIKYEVQEKLVAEHAKRKQIVAAKLTTKKQDFTRLDQSRIQVQNLLSGADDKRRALAQQKVQIESDTRNAQKELNDALVRAAGVLSLVEDQIGKFALSKVPATASRKDSLAPTGTRKAATAAPSNPVVSPRPVARESLREVSVERVIQTETSVADDDELKRK